MPARTTRTDATTRSSIRVKPRSLRSRVVSGLQSPVVCPVAVRLMTCDCRLPTTWILLTCLPVLVFRAVERGAFGLRADVEDVLATPAGCIGVILIRAKAPFVLFRHRIDRHAPEE